MGLPFTTDTVEILTAPEITDSYNNTRRDWTSEEISSVSSAAVVQPESKSELRSAADQVSSTFQLFLPPEISITAYNRVLWNGDQYEVDGKPSPWKGPMGLAHTVVTLKLVEG